MILDSTKYFSLALWSLIIIISTTRASVAFGIISKVLCKQSIKKKKKQHQKQYPQNKNT